ncbi:MAG: PTS sugar transporter subunit IIC, partial [Myxococcaceae bacterium]|nr:PTS sugar transporter subunit IIC [Myxococcaceae bacterium]
LVSALWGGLLSLERRAFLQAALSRPLPAATGVGLLLGDVTTGLMVGLVFELFFLGGVALGGAQVDHETLPAVAGAAFAVNLGHASGADATPAVWALAILIAAPLGLIGRQVDGWLDARARRYLGRLLDAVDAGTVERATRQNLRAMWPHFAFSALVSAMACLGGALLSPAVAQAPIAVVRGLAWAYPLLATVAAAVAVHACQGEGRLRVAAVVALVVALALLGAMGVRAWA